jgi:beta-glucosidase
MDHSFLWGAATSAHQVEGNTTSNDWWAWEQATGAEKSGKACDHYARFADDFVLAKKLGHNAHRISIEWSRIQPRQGVWDREALEHYRAVLGNLRQIGLTSFVTLHHFTNPSWIAEKGGWERASIIGYFTQYVERLTAELGELVDFWLTLNEPIVYATQSFWHKKWPPQRRSIKSVLAVMRHMAAAHRAAYFVIHTRLPGAKVGLPHSYIGYFPQRPSRWEDRAAAAAYNFWYNDLFLYMTRGHHDFLGVNYYFSVTKKWQWWPMRILDVSWTGPTSDMGWPIRPEGLLAILLRLRRYRLPVYITENGIADAADSMRADFLRSHLRMVEKAQAQGVDVRGYLHWSLMDNFEWAEGFRPRFGLLNVDFATQARTPRASAYVFKAIINQAQSRL